MYRLSGNPIRFGFPTEAPSEEGVRGRVGPEYAAPGRELRRSDVKIRAGKCRYIKVYDWGYFLCFLLSYRVLSSLTLTVSICCVPSAVPSWWAMNSAPTVSVSSKNDRR